MEGELISRTDYIEGSSGKGGGGGHTPIEANDTFSSKQTIRLLFALSEGVCQGVDDITFNGVSVSNYPSISWAFRSGAASQSVVKGFSEVEAPLSGTFPAPLTLSPNQVYIGNLAGDVSAARITLGLTKLMQITSDGDRVGYSVSCSIYVRTHTTSSWVFVKSTTKTDKTTNPAAWDIRVDRPDATNPLTQTWGIMVSRDTIDDPNDQFYSVINVAAVTKLYETALSYPNTALVAITLTDASLFNGQVPSIRFKVKGIKMFMPSNYTVATRTYNESVPWNFTFKSIEEYTDNLSWVIYYSLTHIRWGIPIRTSDVDVGSFYTYAKHCDQLVNNGVGGTEPRYRVDIQFIERTNTPAYLMYLLSLGNAQLGLNAYGQISIIYDHAGQAITKQETNATVIDGVFHYSSNGMDERTNSVTATFSSSLLFGDTDMAFEKDDALITQMGIISSDIVLAGCTRESQAKRKCRWAIWSNAKDTSIITFKKLFGGAVYRRGELVTIMDSETVDTVSHHAIVKLSESAGGFTAITLDRPITLTNQAYTVSYILSTGVIQNNVAISQTNGTFSFVTVVGNVSLFLDTTIIFSSASVTPRTYKVIKVTKDEHEYNITCAKHTEAKYSYIDNIDNLVIPDSTGNFVNVTNLIAPAPVNMTFQEVFSSNGVISTSHINVNWQWDIGLTQDYKPIYRITYRRDSTQSVTVDNISTTNYDIPDTIPGIYEVYVWAINPKSGLPSAALFDTYSYRVTAATSTLVAPINLYVENTAGGIFTTPDLVLTWANPTANTDINTPDKLKDYIVEIRNYDSPFTLRKSYPVQPDVNGNGRFVFTYAENVSVFTTATRQFRVRVYCRDLVGDFSTANELVCNNSVPSHLSFSTSFTFGVGVIYVNITASSEKDVVGYIVQQSPDAGFTTTVVVYDGPDTLPSIPVDPSAGNKFYRIAAYDSFGKTGLDYSSSVNGTTSAAAGASDQYAFSGLVFTPNSPTANKVAWSAGTVSKNNAAPITINSGAISTAWSSGTVYIYYPGSGGNTLVSTTDITLAVSGSIIVATYRGGTDINVGNGKAMIDGSNVLAHTIGATQVVTSGLVTEAAQINDGLITNLHVSDTAALSNAKIANDLQSSTYNDVIGAGWKIDKNGKIISYGDLELISAGVSVIPLYDYASNNLALFGNSSILGGYVNKATAAAAWDTQANSNESYTGACALRFNFGSTTLAVMCGLNTAADLTTTTGNVYTYLDYAFYGTSAAGIQIYENGSPVINPATGTVAWGTYTTATDFEIEYSATSIIYKINGATVRTVTVASGLTFYMDSALYSQNGIIRNIQFGTYISTVFTPGVLTFAGNATKHQNLLGRVAGETAGWTAQGYSTVSLTASAMMQLTVIQLALAYAVGLSIAPTTNASYTNLDYCFLTNTANQVLIYENGNPVTNPATGTTIWGTVGLNQVYSIVYIGTTVYYYKSNTLLRQVSTTAGRTFYFDSSINSISSFIKVSFGSPIQAGVVNIGARLQIDGDNIEVYDASNVLRVKLGNLAV